MQLTQLQAEKLLSGDYQFNMWSLAALVTLLKQQYKVNPSALDSYTEELNAFIKKYTNLLGDDKQIFQKL